MSNEIPYDLLFAEPFDPCTAFSELRPHYMRMKLEGRPQKIRFRDREVWFNPVNIENWDNVMIDLQRQCQAQRGRPFRHAITAG